MTCKFHEIGSSAYLIQKHKVLIRGENKIIAANSVGIVKGIDRSNHMLRVYFRDVDAVVELPASALKRPRGMTATHLKD